MEHAKKSCRASKEEEDLSFGGSFFNLPLSFYTILQQRKSFFPILVLSVLSQTWTGEDQIREKLNSFFKI